MADIERKLATVRRIAAIDPIEGADKIVCVTVDGWKLVSAKENGFQVGDLVIYFEIDSFLPVREEFEWLRKSSFKTVPGLGEGFRIKTIKLRGQVSQGLIVPLDDFLQKTEDGKYFYTYEFDGQPVTFVIEDAGVDLTEFLGVKKYEKPIPANMAGRTKGNFPSFIRKTDEERIQNCWGGVKKWILQGTPVVHELSGEALDDAKAILADPNTREMAFQKGYFQSDDKYFFKEIVPNDPEEVARRSQFEKTMKLDGSSITIYYNDGQIGVCSRNLELKRDPDNSFWKAAIQCGILAFLAQYGRNLAFQGELMGPGVQGNRENFEDLRIYLFNIFDIDKQEYLTPEERYQVCNDFDDMDIRIEGCKDSIFHVPFVGFELDFSTATVDEFLNMVDGMHSINHDIIEGVVFKSMVPNGPSFKVISNQYLLKEKD
jgi:hypothetical protein